MGKLTNPTIKNEIINRLTLNEPSESIAKDYNVSGQRIRQIKKEEEDQIEINRQKLIECLPSALEIVQQDLKNGKKITFRYTYNRKSITSEDLQYKAQIQKLISDLFKMLGYFPHTNTSVHIGKIYQDNRIQTKITPEFERFLDFQEAEQVKAIEAEIAEAEYIENQKSKESIDSVNSQLKEDINHAN